MSQESQERLEMRPGLFRRATLGFAAFLGLAAAVWAAEPSQVSPNVPVNAPQQLFPHDNPSRNSSTLAASGDGEELLAGFEDHQGLCGPPTGLACPPETPPGVSGFSFSTDGGQSWTDGGSLFALGNAITAGHPWADRLARGGDDHHAGANHRGHAGGHHGHDTYFLVSTMQDAETGIGAQLGVYRGHFGAGTFVFDDGTIVGPPDPNDQYTRESMAAAKDGSAAAYVAVVNVKEICGVPLGGYGQIEIWRTHDGGASWQGPAIVAKEGADSTDPNDPNCGATGLLQVAPAVAIGPRGEVYVVWQSGPRFAADGSNTPTDAIGFAASFDGGQTFSAPVSIQGHNAMRDNPPVGYAKNRMNDQARIAVAQSGPFRGRIYVGFYTPVAPVTGSPGSQSLVSSQALVMSSGDRGATWSAPVPVDAAPPPTGLKRIWPTVSVRANGDVDVVYLQSQEVATGTTCSVAFNPTSHRTGPVSSLVDTFLVRSRDGGATFSAPLRVSSQTSDWCTAPYSFHSFLLSNAGDYIGTASVDEGTLALWPDDRTGPMDTFYSSILGGDEEP
jgi:hypothetical protein